MMLQGDELVSEDWTVDGDGDDDVPRNGDATA